MDEHQEKEILPGVYLTDYRKEKKSSIIDIINSNENMMEDIIYTINELENSIKHLKRSNEELQNYYKDDPDPLYIEYIEDNKNLIIKQSKRIEDLKSVLKKIDKTSN